MTPSDPNPETEILSIVQACNAHITRPTAGELEMAFTPTGRPSHADDPTPSQLEAVYSTARALCNEGNYRFASALALHLATHKPAEPRFSFLAGTCMQQLGAPATAIRFFCFALVNGGDHPAALFRLGECLLALGDNANADRAFDAALDVARDVEGAEDLQYAAQRLMDTIKSGPHPCL
ncbi:hypothetical protein GHT07_05740 [Caenimonas koreensis DSM 17982]|uniref:Type III secretion low calcium response chaperone LcrH/SycD n=1 Tax=Caenimonas koreensis DSM 17982 TaxID=1121255 RepID=A0A844B5I2_9BURK|nr:hypothetical protein [Caenimonas koreensis]MRD46767.1 hypothetical protein [Caenimonas koreensis DSM 17982]